MPKRSASTNFTCPGCQEKFDTEIHIPFMGSCGDSICAVCLNEKKIKNCLECNMEGGFECSQKNNLALKFLSAAAEKETTDSKKAKLDVGEETNAPSESVPAVSDPKNRPFSCSSCQEKFDSKIRSPFVGFCGHSLCAICVKEKDNTTCPMCNTEGSFAMKRKNDLAAELLVALAEAHERLVPAILKPENRAFLVQIVNQLDPDSFVKFARTCKSMHELCFNSKEIKITYDIPYIEISLYRGSWGFDADDVKGIPSLHTPFDYTGNDRGFLGSAENRKKLRNYPFQFNLEYLHLLMTRCLGCFEKNAFAEIRLFLEECDIRTISKIQTRVCADWNDFVQLMKDFKTGDVEIETDRVDELISIPDESAISLLQNCVRFSSDAYISDEAILQASVHHLHLYMINISKATFVKLLKRFANSTEEIKWTLGHQAFEFSHYGIFTAASVDSFEDDETLPDERPLALVNENDDREFQILREDGKRLRCFIYNYTIVFSTFGDMGEYNDQPSD